MFDKVALFSDISYISSFLDSLFLNNRVRKVTNTCLQESLYRIDASAMNSHSNRRRPPLQSISNVSSILNSPASVDKHNRTENDSRTKRRKITSKSAITKHPPTMASIIQTVNSNTKSQMDDLIKLKQDKQNDLYNLNSEIWKIQTQIPDLELKLEKLASCVSLTKSKFHVLECKIKNIDLVKKEKVQALNDSLLVFKKTLNKSFDEKVAELGRVYDDKVTKIIDNKDLEFRTRLKSMSDEIEVLKNKLLDYSGKIVDEKKIEIAKQKEESLEQFVELETSKLETMKQENTKLQIEIDELHHNIHSLNFRFDTQTQPKLIQLKSNLEDLNNELTSILSIESNLSTQLNQLNDSKEYECNKLLDLQEKNRQLNHEIGNFNSLIQEEEQCRRFLHNQLQELKGNIRVFCRIKPEKENTFSYKIQSMLETSDMKESLTITEPSMVLANSRPTVSLSPMKKHPKSYTFSFDKIFDETASNGDIFEEISQLIQSSLDGFNVCIFTYGQTGSGKTFTMSNPNDGIIPRSMILVFDRINVLASLGNVFKIYGQFFEIYGDNIKDLIDKDFHSDVTSEKELNIDDKIDVRMIKLTSITEIEKLLNHANKKRATASTMANDVSSRSHSIFRVHILKFDQSSSKFVKSGILNLVDLAGSERLSRSQVTGVRLQETLSINKSLSSLGDVISSLKSKSSHIPYRNSKLTYSLKDSLGGDSKTLMFVNISCLNSHFNESLSSLRFATKVNNTSLNK